MLAKAEVASRGFGEMLDVTAVVGRLVGQTGLVDGLVKVYCAGTTAALVLVRNEPGALADLAALMEQLAPEGRLYQHEVLSGDPNGFAHLRSCLLGTSLIVPAEGGRLSLASNQSILLLDFDPRAAQRTLYVGV